MIIRPKVSDRTRLSALFANRPTKTRGLSMPEFAETTVVTAGPRKGERFQLSYSPYLIRPMELLSPESIIQQVFLMFPAQSAKSVCAQIMTGYYAKEVPSEMLYATADQATARKQMERRIEPLYKSIDIAFRTQSENKSSRRTGDIAFSKEFDGGNIDIVTANSPAALAAETKRIGIGDELDRWKLALGVEGSPWAQLYARLKAWMDEKKALGVSTPTDEDVSLIFALYLTGTKEEWSMPCLLCGKQQILEVKNDSGWGLDYETRNGNVIKSSIVYVCKHCAKSFKEINKFDMLQNGIWVPHPTFTGPPVDEFTASFHLTALNSMFESWFEVAKGYEAGMDSAEKKKEFQNLTMGLPFKQVGARPKASAVMENKGDYPVQTVPDGVAFLVSSTDVQRGADRYANMTDEQLEADIAKAVKAGTAYEKKFPRLEMLVMGKGPGYRSWAIDYRVFYGRTNYAFSGAWEKLNDYKENIANLNGGYGFKRHKDGKFFPIVTSLIDAGFNPDVSYQFSQRWDWTYISKGAREIPAPKNVKNIPLTADNMNKYRVGKSTAVQGAVFYEIGTKRYKQLIYGSLKIQRIDHEIQSPGFIDFPRDNDIFNIKYFDGLTAEEKVSDTGNYDNAGRPNEQLDTHVMCECAADIYLDAFTKSLIENSKATGKYTALQLQAIDRKSAILILSKNAGIDERYNDAPIRRT